MSDEDIARNVMALRDELNAIGSAGRTHDEWATVREIMERRVELCAHMTPAYQLTTGETPCEGV